MTNIFNTSLSKKGRRDLRKRSTSLEKIVWLKIRNRQIENYKFRRQYSIGKYIVDFYCPEKKLVVEIDGDSHFQDEAILYDIVREKYIRTLNIEILRFTNKDVMDNIDGVLFKIAHKLKNGSS